MQAHLLAHLAASGGGAGGDPYAGLAGLLAPEHAAALAAHHQQQQQQAVQAAMLQVQPPVNRCTTVLAWCDWCREVWVIPTSRQRPQ